MNARRGHIAAGALLLVLFSGQTPAPQVPGSALGDAVAQLPDAVPDCRNPAHRGAGTESDPCLNYLALVALSEAQTAALNALNEKLATIDKRVLKLERE
jgi:hypothetical protein